MSSNSNPHIIRRIEVIEGGGHHGGAWKVAYADFMTAMMAFFLLMWILSSSDEEKLRGVAEYFTLATMPGGSGILDGATLGPPGTLSASNGAIVTRGSELGKVDDQSPSTWDVKDDTATADPVEKLRGSEEGRHDNPAGGDNLDIEQVTEADAKNMASPTIDTPAGEEAQDHSREDAKFAELEAEIVQAIQKSPDLRPLMANVIFERTPEGLRIQIVDQEGKSMFPRGSERMTNDARLLMTQLGKSLTSLPNSMVITGHTDGVPFANPTDYDNWDLSSDRANALRRTLTKTGIENRRITRVAGKGATDPLFPESPNHPSNRRITLLLKYQSAHSGSAISVHKTTAPLPDSGGELDEANLTPTNDATTKLALKDPHESKVVQIDARAFKSLRNALR